jgi:hypothetical protein
MEMDEDAAIRGHEGQRAWLMETRGLGVAAWRAVHGPFRPMAVFGPRLAAGRPPVAPFGESRFSGDCAIGACATAKEVNSDGLHWSCDGQGFRTARMSYGWRIHSFIVAGQLDAWEMQR